MAEKGQDVIHSITNSIWGDGSTATLVFTTPGEEDQELSLLLDKEGFH